MSPALVPLLWALLAGSGAYPEPVCESGQPFDDYAADAGRDACTGAWLEADTLEPGAADPHSEAAP